MYCNNTWEKSLPREEGQPSKESNQERFLRIGPRAHLEARWALSVGPVEVSYGRKSLIGIPNSISNGFFFLFFIRKKKWRPDNL